ncbi:SusD/RagB family nutrient-binding outer membrane lipoprotein [Wenyingzhuangia aestuarii]|uniref:SusD/RagB family nutrient-binding outer membrane lipoprotein n=1 Tax=Wenyingzhuangia aestuarii TaxID=1647582 RepID=UPI00143933D6|nr:SusD/RagB family nutrient-binding outer membrane lipoprotein [Wenyingzhuangia aestuarii]NJB83086.1 hypothetical protein [Wenyingzhuangia aestuarii]
MKNYIYTFIILGLSFVSCTHNFEEINTNPNAPNRVTSDLLLRQVVYNFAEEMSYEGFVAGDLLGQYRTALDFNLFDRHDLKSPQLGGNPWAIFYTNLRDNQILLEQSKTQISETVYKGPSLILKAYMTAGLTDLFGDVPYFDAFDGINKEVTPAYDSQQAIYTAPLGILDNLEKANTAIDAYTGSIPLNGDLLFNGDLDGWKRMSNSLQLKYLLRISKKMDVSEKMQALFTEDYFIKENHQNAVFNFSANAPNNFRLSRLRIGDFNNFVLSETYENILTSLNDPRLNTLFRPFENSNSEDFKGLFNGINPSVTQVNLADYSLASSLFRENSSSLKANFITAWETYFILAEAAQKGLITADAKNLYEQGVTLAFEYWNTSLPDDYLINNANFNAPGTTPLQQISTQKWIANIINGYEGWTEYRRTGFPELQTISASLNNNIIPARMPYPTDEITLNQENYNKVASKTNNNSINVPVWWNE